jgi:hypothetical protein
MDQLNGSPEFYAYIGAMDRFTGRELPEVSCIWSQTDSTTADGWMSKNTFNDTSAVSFHRIERTGKGTDLGEILTRQRKILWRPE